MRLRVVGYNTRSFRVGMDGAADALEGKPDLVLLQECGSRRAVRRFARRLGMESVSSHRAFSRVRNAVLFDPAWHPVRVTVRTLGREGRVPARGFLAVGLRRGPFRVTAVSTHLGLFPRERERHARELTDWLMATRGHVVLGADLNEGPEGPAARWLAGRLYDAFALRGDGAGATFPADAPTARIDYLFVSEGVGVLGSRVPATDAAARGSDHRPVVAEIQLAET